MRQSVSQTGTYKAMLTHNTTAKTPVLEASPSSQAPWVLARPTGKDRSLLSVLINIYIFMYNLLGEGGGVCNIYFNLCRGAGYAPLP